MLKTYKETILTLPEIEKRFDEAKYHKMLAKSLLRELPETSTMRQEYQANYNYWAKEYGYWAEKLKEALR